MPDETVARRQRRAQHDAGVRPLRGRNEIAFRIAARRGQMRIVVMTQMRVPIDRIGKPHRERGDAEHHVGERPARRVSVQQFVLKRHVPAGQQCKQPERERQAEHARIERGDAEPTGVHGDNHGPRRPFAAPAPRRAPGLNVEGLSVVEITGHGGRERFER